MFFRRHSMLVLWASTALAALAYNVTGVVTDRSGAPLPDATVRILQASDSAFVKGGIADTAGCFSVGGVGKGDYLLETSYIGYITTHTPLKVIDRNVAVDTVRVAESEIMLSEATVVEVKPAMRVMQDTVRV